jgi:hypothetical protein
MVQLTSKFWYPDTVIHPSAIFSYRPYYIIIYLSPRRVIHERMIVLGHSVFKIISAFCSETDTSGILALLHKPHGALFILWSLLWVPCAPYDSSPLPIMRRLPAHLSSSDRHPRGDIAIPPPRRLDWHHRTPSICPLIRLVYAQARLLHFRC